MKKIILMLAIGVLTSLFAIAQTEPTDTDGDGYLNISTLDHLRWVSETPESWDKNFELDNDINASDTRNWNIGDHDNDPATPDSAMGWSPIGDFQKPFTGNFEGNSFKIDSLYINRPREDYIGLFGCRVNSKVENINLLNCSIRGRDYVGALSGSVIISSFDKDALTSNVTISGKVEGRDYVGGIGGQLTRRNVKCSNFANVIGNDYVGGIAGELSNSLILSYNRGNVTGNDYVGGIAGKSFANIEQCYSNSKVTGNDFVGGISGEHEILDNQNCFTRGEVIGNQNVGGLIGYNKGDYYQSYVYGEFDFAYSTAKITGNKDVGALIGNTNVYASGSYWDIETCGVDSSKGGKPKTTAEMKTKSTFTDAGWDFNDIWDINPAINDGYPYLQDVTITSVQENIIELDETAMLVYPNPASDYIVINPPQSP